MPREDRARTLGAAEQRGLGERLCARRRRGERRHSDQSAERRLARRGVDQVVRDAPVGAAPDARTDPGGRKRTAAQVQRRERASALERVGYPDGARAVGGSSDTQVAAAANGP